jgi:flagellar basal body-associated protein FliL
MSTGYIIMGLVVVIVVILGAGATYLNYERRKYERKLTTQAKETAENEKRKADIITEAEKDKSEVRTGDHAHDLRTMADKLHEYANAGK